MFHFPTCPTLFVLVLLHPTICPAQTPASGWTRHTVDATSQGADGVRLADVNGDGLSDIATGWEQGNLIRVYLHPGVENVKRPWPHVTVGRVGDPEDAVFADLDGDGAMDVISSCEGQTRTVFIHWAPSERERYADERAWETTALLVTQQKQAWMFSLPMDINGDGQIDLVVGSKGSNASIGWLRSPEDPRNTSAWTFHNLYDASWIMSLQAHDMDGDQDLDILASNRKGRNPGILWLENPGAKEAATHSAWVEHRVDPSDRQVMFLTTGTFLPDQPEIVCATSGKGIARYARGHGNWGNWKLTEVAMPPHYGRGKGVAIGDINLDGRRDIVFSCDSAHGDLSGVGWLSYRESATETEWEDHEISGAAGTKFDRIELMDIDGDGDLDVLTCEETENLGVIWYENPTK